MAFIFDCVSSPIQLVQRKLRPDRVLQLSPKIMSAVTGSTAGAAGVLAPDSPHSGLKRSLDQDQDRSDFSKKHKQDLASLPTRQYLDQTVVPILLQVDIVILLR